MSRRDTTKRKTRTAAPPERRPDESGAWKALDPRSEAPANDYDAFTAPPLHAKTNPPAEMNDAALPIDDERRAGQHHPQDSGVTDFEFEPEAADAAADLAGELGSQFLEGATRGEDLSARVSESEDSEEAHDLPFLVEEEGPPSIVVVPESGSEDVDQEAPTLRMKRSPGR